jgi:hypothetical protein
MTAATQPGLDKVLYTSAGKAGQTALKSSYAGHSYAGLQQEVLQILNIATRACSSQNSHLTFLGSACN